MIPDPGWPARQTQDFPSSLHHSFPYILHWMWDKLLPATGGIQWRRQRMRGSEGLREDFLLFGFKVVSGFPASDLGM